MKRNFNINRNFDIGKNLLDWNYEINRNFYIIQTDFSEFWGRNVEIRPKKKSNSAMRLNAVNNLEFWKKKTESL